MSTLKDQLPAIALTALAMGALLAGYAVYVNKKVVPAQQRALEEMRLAHSADLERASAETRREIAAVSKALEEAVATRAGGMFQTEEEVAQAETARMERLAEVVATKLQPYQPLPRTPEEAAALEAAQVDRVSGRLSERIQPILSTIASDQNLTRESLDRYAAQISREVSVVLASELDRNERLGAQVQATQSLAQESLALSHELTALYLGSIKDQGVLNRLLLLPANLVRDASNFSLLNSEERRAKEAELTARLRDLQSRLDGSRASAAAPSAAISQAPQTEEPAPGLVVEPVAAPTSTVAAPTAAPARFAPTRPVTN